MLLPYQTAKPTDSAAYQGIDRPLAAMPKRFEAGCTIAWHSHPRVQLLFAAQGIMTVRAQGRLWRLPANRGLWIPAGVGHEIHMPCAVDMRTLYLETPTLSPSDCRVLDITPLVRELILRATELPMLYDERSADGLLVQLLLAELSTLGGLDLGLRVPASQDLLQLCQHWSASLEQRQPAQVWARSLGISARTLSRRFSQETGMTFDQWCTEYLLREAHARLVAGERVLDVCLALGYASPAAFCRLFKRRFGLTPGGLRRGQPRSGSDQVRPTVPTWEG